MDGSSLIFLLLASRDAVLRTRVAGLLRPAGYAVLEAATAEEALRQVVAPASLVIVDASLAALCSHLRAESPLAGVRILALSDGCPHADATLPRPLAPARLLHAVREQLAVAGSPVTGSATASFRSLTEGLTTRVALLDTNGVILAVNDAWRVFARRHLATTRGGSVDAFSEGADYLATCGDGGGEEPIPADRLRDVLTGRRTGYAHEYLCRLMGELRWLVARVRRVQLAGQPFVLVTHENITDRAKVRVALEETERRLADLLDQSRDALLVVAAATGRLEFLSRGAEYFLGQRREDMLGRPLGDFLPHQRLKEGLAHVCAGVTASATEECYFPHSSCWVECHVEPAGRDDVLVHLRDVSRAREAREAHARTQAERIDRLEAEARQLRLLLLSSVQPGGQSTEEEEEEGQGGDDRVLAELLQGWTREYAEVVELALDQRAYRVDHNLSDRLRRLAEQLGLASAGPRDVVEVHTRALQQKTHDAPSGRAYTYKEESRLLLLELMGHLASYYRRRCGGGREGGGIIA